MSHLYVRTTMRIVEALRVSCELAARRTFDGGPEMSGEEQTLILLRRYWVATGDAELEALAQLVLLQTSNPDIRIARGSPHRDPGADATDAKDNTSFGCCDPDHCAAPSAASSFLEASVAGSAA